MTLAERYWAKVDVRGTDDCWPWTAATRNGYGHIGVGQTTDYAHRVGARLAGHLLAAEIEVHHRCENKLCQNPHHWIIEPEGDHKRRHVHVLIEARRRQPLASHCKRGHEFTPENTKPTSRGGRRCRTCTNDEQRERYARRTP